MPVQSVEQVELQESHFLSLKNNADILNDLHSMPGIYTPTNPGFSSF